MSDLDLFDGNGTHADMRNKTNTALTTLNNDKVEKVAGKGLSTNDFTNADVGKLAGTQEALVNQQNIKSINGGSILGSGDLEIVIGSGGYAANVYLTELVSTTNPTYNQISYTPDALSTTVDVVCNNNEVLLDGYIFDGDVDADGIPAGEWSFHFHRFVSHTQGVTNLRFEIFSREANGTENVLFSISSGEIDDKDSALEHILITKEAIPLNPTDRVGIKVYAATTRNSNTIVSIIVGDGEASYFTAPIAIRHNQMRARDAENSHPIGAITGLVSELVSKVELDRYYNAHGILGERDTDNDFTTPATVANQFTTEAKEYRIGNQIIDMPATVITLPTAPDGLDELDGTGRYVDLAAAVVAGGNDLTQSVIERDDVIVLRDDATYVIHQGLRNYTDAADAMVALGYALALGERTLWTDGSDTFVFVGHIPRLNQGLYSPEFNAQGSKKAVDDLFWYNTATSFTSRSDCFDSTKLLATSGYMSSAKTGRITTDNHPYYDGIKLGQILDERPMVRKTVHSERIEFAQKGIADKIRGKEGVPFTKAISTGDQPATLMFSGGYVVDKAEFAIGDSISVYDVTSGSVFLTKAIVTATNTDGNGDFIQWGNDPVIQLTAGQLLYFVRERLLPTRFVDVPWQDIIANDPANIAVTYPDGCLGRWIPQTSFPYDLSRKVYTQGVRTFTSDGGVTWTASGNMGTFDVTNNQITDNYGANHVALIQYTTGANPYKLVNNSKRVGELGDLFAVNQEGVIYGGILVSHLLGKVATTLGTVSTWSSRLTGDYTDPNTGLLSVLAGYEPTHDITNLLAGGAAVKTVPYITVIDGEYNLVWLANEMKYDIDWGDTGKLVVVDGESTFVDDNGNTCVTVQKAYPLGLYTGE